MRKTRPWCRFCGARVPVFGDICPDCSPADEELDALERMRREELTR